MRALVDAGAPSQDELDLLVDFYMQMGRLVGAAANAAEKARLIGLADDMGRLFDAAPLNAAAKARVARMRESLQSHR